MKLERSLPYKFKLDIYVTKGTHSTEEDGVFVLVAGVICVLAVASVLLYQNHVHFVKIQ